MAGKTSFPLRRLFGLSCAYWCLRPLRTQYTSVTINTFHCVSGHWRIQGAPPTPQRSTFIHLTYIFFKCSYLGSQHHQWGWHPLYGKSCKDSLVFTFIFFETFLPWELPPLWGKFWIRHQAVWLLFCENNINLRTTFWVNTSWNVNLSLSISENGTRPPPHQGSRFFRFDIQNFRNITALGVHAPWWGPRLPVRSTPPDDIHAPPRQGPHPPDEVHAPPGNPGSTTLLFS